MAPDETSSEVSPTTRLNALESWRGNVLRGLLSVAAIVSPIIVLISLALGSGPRGPLWP